MKTMLMARVLHRAHQNHIAVLAQTGKQTNDGLLFDGAALARLMKAMTEPFDDLSIDSKAVYYYQARYIMSELGMPDGDEE